MSNGLLDLCLCAGKSTFLKALTGHLSVGSAHLEGEILYNGDSVDSGKYLVGKIANYVDEKEIHAATLTVRETLEFAASLAMTPRTSPRPKCAFGTLLRTTDP